MSWINPATNAHPRNTWVVMARTISTPCSRRSNAASPTANGPSAWAWESGAPFRAPAGGLGVVGARHPRQVIVYRYKARWPVPEYLPKWGTWNAIAALDGCIPIGSSARHVPATVVDAEGFLTLDATPDDFDSRG